MIPREAARLALACAQLLAPQRLAAGALGEQLAPSDQWVARVLGLRNLVQAILVSRSTSRPRALVVGAAVDLAHAGTMVTLATASRRHRWLAAAEAIEATWFGVDQLLAYREAVTGRAVAARRFAASVSHRHDVEARMAALDDTSVLLDSEEPAYERRRATAAALQRAIDAVQDRGGSPAEMTAALNAAVAAQGLSPQPPVWVHNVADELSAGRHYVVSADSSPLGAWSANRDLAQDR